MNQPKPFFQSKIVFTLLSMGLVGGLIGLVIGVANGSGFLGLLIGIILVVFISITGISASQNENTMRYTICAFFALAAFYFLGVVVINLARYCLFVLSILKYEIVLLNSLPLPPVGCPSKRRERLLSLL